MARIARVLAWVAALLLGLPLVLIALVLVGGNTGPGRHLIERLTPTLTGGEVRIGGLTGRFPDRLRAASVQLDDPSGAYLTVQDLALDWSPLRLIHGVLDIDRLDVGAATLVRLPQSGGSSSTGLPVQVVLRQFQADRLTVAPAVAGHSETVALNGAATLAAMDDVSFRLAVRQSGGDGRYSLAGSIDAQHLRATIQANEQAHGLISGLAGLPDLGPIAIDATLDGPRDAIAARLTAAAGPLRAQAGGTLDLVHQAADLSVNATAPAMTPRPDLEWQSVAVDAHVHGAFIRPTLSGQVRIAGLRAAGAGVQRLLADLSGDAGTAHLGATFEGVTLPGQDPRLLAAAPVLLDATMRLDAPDRPVDFTLRHPLIQAEGTARTAGTVSAHVVLTLPDLGPVAAAGGQDVQGHTALTLDVARQGPDTTLALRGTLGVTGGQKQAQALLGETAQVDLAASLAGQDAHLTRLHVSGRGVDVTAHGSLVQQRVSLDWTLAVTDLTALDPELTGRIDATGRLSGPEDDLAATADLNGTVAARGIESGPLTLRLQATGLPGRPSGSATAGGSFLGAPVDLAVAVQRDAGALHVTVQKAAWKSLQADGALTLPTGATMPLGTLRLQMTRLADLQPLLHRAVAGSIDAALDASATAARLRLTARGLAMPGTAALSNLALDATVTDPLTRPTVQASLTADGVGAGSVTGASARLEAHGGQDALVVTLSAAAPGLAGAPARVDAAATVNVPARSVALSSLRADWQQQSLRLLAPARFDFAQGGAIDHLRLGLRQAVLAVDGRIAPVLDLTASLRNLPADIAAAAEPAAAVDGTIAADARLTGSLAHPDGTVRVTATGVRQRSGPGRSLPPANLTATATLSGMTARLDSRLVAGASHLTLTGTAPLAASGALDLRAGGSLNLALLDPILTAEGRRVRGELGLDATITGATTAPRIAGTARLTGGDAQDYAQGVHVTDIAATVQADGDHVRLVQLSGRAGQGSIGGSGTIALAAPMPVDMTVTADNATLLSSPLITATLDAHLTVQGALAGDLTAAGLLHVRQANVQVPNKLPSSVAVLPVQVAGAPRKARPAGGPLKAGPAGAAPAPSATARTIRLNVTLDAPQQVFIRGRGLEVELGGRIQIGGTAASPQPDGALHLRRGTLSVVGQTLTFTDGSIDFLGRPLTDPGIRLVATSSTNAVTATLTVSGDAQNPRITLSSVPQLPQDEILAQLLFHQATGTLSPFQVAEIAAGLAELSGTSSGIGDPLASLRNSLGLDQLSVGSSAKGSPTLQAGRYLAPGVYLGAQQAASGGGGTQATLQIDLTKGLKLETSAGTSSPSATGAASGGQGVGVGLTYQFQY